MPEADDDFSTDDYAEAPAADDRPTEEELAAARRLLLAAGEPVAITTPTPRAPQTNRAERRKKRKRDVVPEGAPAPQDHLPKQDSRAAEVTSGSTIVLTLWDKEVRVTQADLLNSWDFQIGVAQGNPMMMVKGLLGAKLFSWFAVRAQGDGKTPIEAATEVMSMFNRQTGFDDSGK